jgi:hypothetical protein
MQRRDATRLTDEFLSALVAESAGTSLVGMLLLGSHARGEATPYSDVDLVRLASTPPETGPDRYTLVYRQGYLISLSTTTVADKRAELVRPETAIWAVPGLRQARVLLDRDGSVEALLGEARAFEWAPLQPAADAYASYEVMGLAEEVHKVLGALLRGDESASAYGTWGLVIGLPRAVAVQRGLLIQTENAYLRQVVEAVGEGAAWARAFQTAGGFCLGPGAASPVMERAVAALRLYEETASLLHRCLQAEHLPVIRGALDRIHSALASL